MHLAVVEFLVGHQVEIPCACQAEKDGFCFPGLFALFRFIHRSQNRVAALRGGEDALYPGKLLRHLEDIGLIDRYGFHIPIGVKLAEGGTHAMEP